MSSMRNAVQRRPHRERAQPLERRRLGLLEKHKDYSLRAADYGKKKAQLKALRQKAADRNEDEFYFGMMSRKGPGSRIMNGKNWNGTVQGDRGNKTLDRETMRLLKTQDLGYVRTMRQVVSKEVSRLEEQIVLTRGLDRLDEEDEDNDDDSDEDESDNDKRPRVAKLKAPRKIIFTDDAEQRDELLQDAIGSGQEGEEDEAKENTGDDLDREKMLRRLKRQLEDARKKVRALTDAEQELEIQRAKTAKTATSGGQTRKGRKIMVRRRKR